MLKLDRFSCSQKIQLKWDPPVLLLAFLMCNFVVETTKLQSNNKNNNMNNNNKKIELFITEQKMDVD